MDSFRYTPIRTDLLEAADNRTFSVHEDIKDACSVNLKGFRQQLPTGSQRRGETPSWIATASSRSPTRAPSRNVSASCDDETSDVNCDELLDLNDRIDCSANDLTTVEKQWRSVVNDVVLGAISSRQSAVVLTELSSQMSEKLRAIAGIEEQLRRIMERLDSSVFVPDEHHYSASSFVRLNMAGSQRSVEGTIKMRDRRQMVQQLVEDIRRVRRVFHDVDRSILASIG